MRVKQQKSKLYTATCNPKHDDVPSKLDPQHLEVQLFKPWYVMYSRTSQQLEA